MRRRPRRALLLASLLVTTAVSASGRQVALPWAAAKDAAKPPTEAVDAADLPRARARLEAGSDIWVGQAVPIVVEVIVPSWFTGSPRFPEIDVPKAITLSPEPVWNFTVSSGRQTFAGQAKRYLVFPLVEGRYHLPALRANVSYAQPTGGSPTAVSLPVTGAIAFVARLPAGAGGARYFLTTDGFRVRQSLSRKPGDMQVGDALVRTIVMDARNTVGTSIPPLQFDAPDGLRLYAGTPVVTETAERGAVEATRTEKATYVAEKAGRYTIPEIAILWWSPTTKAMNRAVAPAVTVEVRAAAEGGPEMFASSQVDERGTNDAAPLSRGRLSAALRLALAAAAVVAVALAARRLLGRRGFSPKAWLARRRKRVAESEATRFARFRKACLSEDPQAALRQLLGWLDRAGDDAAVQTLTRFTAESGDAALAAGTRALNELLFARQPRTVQAGGRWAGRGYYELVARARRSRVAAASRASKHDGRRRADLPPTLNPASARVRRTD